MYFYCNAEGLECVQDTIIVVLPYPYSKADDIDDAPFEGCWHARSQLFFKCHHRPTGRPYGRQSPPHTLVSGWLLNSYNPTHVMQAQGFWLPLRMCSLTGNHFRW